MKHVRRFFPSVSLVVGLLTLGVLSPSELSATPHVVVFGFTGAVQELLCQLV